MLNLAQLLSLSGLNITFLNTDHNHNRLVLHTDILDRFACFLGFQFKSIPDGLPADHPQAATGQSVTCIIADGSLSFPIDVGNELGIPAIHFRTISACSFWAYFCIQDMIEAGELPIRGIFLTLAKFVFGFLFT
ncbi:hypothetical protein SO802_016490 [Lithocarpus litseifolius]|uniref:Uncharacterized protein n=1 Tax=Lithocarpus litseifolius TaxID=425828 RepID=A0AAW2CZ77_9ROSI